MYRQIAAVVVTAACLPLGLGCGGVEPPDHYLLEDRRDAGAGDGGDPGAESSVVVGVEVSGLVGTGLVLETALGQRITITADGSVTVSPPVPIGESAITVVSQPVEPSQVCTVTLRPTGVVLVSCATRPYKLGGTVSGLLGAGLVLAAGEEQLAIAQNGPFQFAGGVANQSPYEVRVVAQPTAPSQACAVTDASGHVNGKDVDRPSVTCTTNKFRVGGEVLGLTGKGLVLALEGGEQKAIASDGRFAFSPLPDGSSFSVIIAQLPDGDQECEVVQGKGVLAGQDVNDVTVVCGALGNLRITEVGSCYYADSACWVEITNIGGKVENLGAHRLRTPARGMSTKEATHTFVLPDLAVQPNAYVVVRGLSTQALADGGGVVHISDDGFLPWWDGSGFVELLGNQGTVDFMRFGDSKVRATSAYDAWKWDDEGVDAPALAGTQLGRSLARDRKVTDSGGGKDWTLRAFATPGGPNDVTSDADNDEDGIPDVSEVQGGTFAGLDLYAMGARTGRRDIFVEIDRMSSSDPAVRPRREALDKVVAAFARKNIAVHFDVGDEFTSGFNPALHNLGGGNVVPFHKAVALAPTDTTTYADVYQYKATHMAPARRSVFFYMLFAWSQEPDGTSGASGVGELRGNDSVITLGGYGLNEASETGRNVLTNLQALTVMHELGHNLGLTHGGDDQHNMKPNYVSVMNYLYSLGLPVIGSASEGDRYDIETGCTLKYLNELANGPAGSPAHFLIDYSDGLSADINEASVDESEGLGRLNSVAIDFNCNKKIDAPYAKDLNMNGRGGDRLSDHDDWSAIDIVFRRWRAGTETGPYFPGLGPSGERDLRDDLLTDDQQPAPDQPCPALRLF